MDVHAVSATDEAIIARVLAGDTEAFATLVARHRDRCVRYAWRMLGDRDEAEDVTQETFVRAYRSLVRCSDPVRFGAWLFQILVNRCRTAAAKRSRRNRLFASDLVDVAELADVAPTPVPGLDGPSLAEIERAVARLQPAAREAFLLKYVEEMTYEQMAQATGANVSALKMRVSRACDFLRAHLSGVYHAG